MRVGALCNRKAETIPEAHGVDELALRAVAGLAIERNEADALGRGRKTRVRSRVASRSSLSIPAGLRCAEPR